MHADVKEPSRTVVPTLRYRDVAAAIEWLCKAFGFERHLVVPGDNGAVRYAELTFGDGMIMLGPVEDSAFDKLMTQPEDAGGAETQICYLFVADAGAHCARAKAAGAEIVLDIEEEEGGGRGYSCRDLEGHIWNFGTYNPWKRQAARSSRAGGSGRGSKVLGRGLKRVALVSGLLVSVAASAAVVAWALGAADATRHQLEPRASAGAPADTTDAERMVKDVREQLARERSAKETAERGARTVREQLSQERHAKDAAERAARGVQAQLAQERDAKEAAERVARTAREQLALERTAKEVAERAAKEVQGQFAQERSAREVAERSVREAREQLTSAASEHAVKELREQLGRERGALETAQRIVQETREQLSLAERSAEAVHEQLAAERSAREAAEQANQQAQEELAKERSAKESAERTKQQAREKAAKERAAKEASERAAKEARERRQRAARPVVRRQAPAAEPAPSSTPFVNWQ
jgi:uncharacterized glyoxalase superfamily protein PhnB